MSIILPILFLLILEEPWVTTKASHLNFLISVDYLTSLLQTANFVNMASASAPEKATQAASERLEKAYAAFQERVKRTVYLDNISPQVNIPVIRTALGQFGNVVNVEFILNYTIPFDIPQCALVEMENEKEAAAVISEMKNFPFMILGMPRPARALPAKPEMFADRPSPPNRKIQLRWVKPSDPEFEVGKKLKHLVKRHRAETNAMIEVSNGPFSDYVLRDAQ